VSEKRFQRKKEDFSCKKCGFFVRGDGFTDHCPRCLWSRHVDINPGDRNENCRGMMEPTGAKKEGEEYIIYYRCVECGFVQRVKKGKNDNFEEIIKISKTPIEDAKERD
jgi:Zn finger protein HypA/HybF involved in hydrogenase expression